MASAGQAWVNNQFGGFWANTGLSEELRQAAEPYYRFRQFVRPIEAATRGVGDTVNFLRVSNINSLATAVGEMDLAPEVQVTTSKGSILMQEYVQQISWTSKLEILSQFDVEDVVMTQLKINMAMSLDKECSTAFKKTKIKGTPVNGSGLVISTTGTAGGTCDTKITASHIKDARDYLFGTLIAPAIDSDGNYVCISSVKTARGLMDDAEWRDVTNFGNPDRQFNGEAGLYYGTRFVISNNNNAISNSIGGGQAGEAFIIGYDPVVEAVAQPEEIVIGVTGDLGRRRSIGWTGILGWEITWDTATAGEARVLHITSL